MPIRVTREDIDRFVVHCQKKAPGFSIHDGKKTSYLMNVIDGLVWVFNPKFMERYITTIVGKVYFPDGSVGKDPLATLEIGSHEFIHAYDAKRLTPPLFGLLYLSPQILSLVLLALYGFLVCWSGFLPFAALAVHLGVTALTFKARKVTGLPLLLASIAAAVLLSALLVGIDSLWLLAAIIPLAPIPSPGRAWAEFRGYGMSIHFKFWIDEDPNPVSKVKQFTTGLYYRMWPFADRVLKKLQGYEKKARAGDVTDPAYVHILKFIEELKNNQ